MRVLLIDVDSKIPNLALMKISAYHKTRGDEVGFNIADPDLIYASIIFTRNKQWGIGLRRYLYPYTKVKSGGPGYSMETLPSAIEALKPDYDLYPSTYSQGFTTRGCIRNCHFCIVPQKEGKLVRWQHPREFYDDRFGKIMLMDNNWLADQEWFFETSAWLCDKDLQVMEHGMDIRLLNTEVVKRLQALHMVYPIHFAFDFSSLEPLIKEKVALLALYGFDLKHQVMFYVYCDSDAQFADALHRCNILRELGTQAFVMFNINHRPTLRVNRLRRWANRPFLFWKFEFKDYTRKKGMATI